MLKNLDLMEDEDFLEEVNDDSFIPMLKSDDEADDALAKIIWAKKKVEENNQKIKKKKEELEKMLGDYEKRLNKNLKSYIDYQSALLRGYLKDNKGNKTLKLFHGNVRVRKPSESLTIDDENMLVNWLKEAGYKDCIKVKEAISKTNLKKAFKKDPSGEYLIDDSGNVIHGVHFERGEETIQITEPKGA